MQTVCTSFKLELLNGVHNFTSDVFKIALYTSAATLDADTTQYTVANESSGAGYSVGGLVLTTITPTSANGTAYVSFQDAEWNGASFTAAQALIYNSSKSNKAVCVLDFGGTKNPANNKFSISFPAANSTTAIIRIA